MSGNENVREQEVRWLARRAKRRDLLRAPGLWIAVYLLILLGGTAVLYFAANAIRPGKLVAIAAGFVWVLVAQMLTAALALRWEKDQ